MQEDWEWASDKTSMVGCYANEATGGAISHKGVKTLAKSSLLAARRHAKRYLEYPLSFAGSALVQFAEVTLPLERM